MASYDDAIDAAERTYHRVVSAAADVFANAESSAWNALEAAADAAESAFFDGKTLADNTLSDALTAASDLWSSGEASAWAAFTAAAGPLPDPNDPYASYTDAEMAAMFGAVDEASDYVDPYADYNPFASSSETPATPTGTPPQTAGPTGTTPYGEPQGVEESEPPSSSENSPNAPVNDVDELMERMFPPEPSSLPPGYNPYGTSCLGSSPVTHAGSCPEIDGFFDGLTGAGHDLGVFGYTAYDNPWAVVDAAGSAASGAANAAWDWAGDAYDDPGGAIRDAIASGHRLATELEETLENADSEYIAGLFGRAAFDKLLGSVAAPFASVVGKYFKPGTRGASVDQMVPEEALRYERYWQQGHDAIPGNTRQRIQVSPDLKSVIDQKLSKDGTYMYERETVFDDFGRRAGNSDYTDHGRPDIHPNPHHHPNDPLNPSQHGPVTEGLHPLTPRR